MPADGVADPSRRRPTSVADAEPIPRAWLVGGGIVLGAMLVVALVAAAVEGGPGASEDGRAAGALTGVARDGAGLAPQSAPGSPPMRPSPPAPRARDAAAARDVQLKALLYDLQEGKACPDRRAAIPRLVELDDPRALPALKAARYRLRGSQSNTNECLRKDAEAAIKALGRPR
jgi:hypothetical protein